MARPAVKKGCMEQAAIRLFAEQGLSKTTIRRIAEAAGVGEGALYRHWRGKNEMAWDLYCRQTRAFTEAFAPVLAAADSSLAGRLTAGVRFVYEYYRDHADELIFILLTRQSFPAQRLQEADAIDPDETILQFLRREMRRGSIRPGKTTLKMAMLRGLVIEPIYMHRYGALKTHPLRRATEVADACLRVLTGGLDD